MFEQNSFNVTMLETAYQALSTIKNTPLTMEQFHANVRYLTGVHLEEFLSTTTPDSILEWYYDKFHDQRIKSMTFTIRNRMWTYEEYERLGVSAVRGMGKCVCCGELTNVVAHGPKQDWVCSLNCLNNLRRKGNQ